MEAVNDFSRGMQSDISKLIQAKNTYLEAVNFRPFSELGGSGGSLVTIKGNTCGVKFPTMRDVFKLKINIKRVGTFTDTVDITISGTWGSDTISAFTVNSGTSISTLYTQIKAFPNYGVYYEAAYKDDYIVIFQKTSISQCDEDVEDFTVSVTENIAPGTQNTISFIQYDNTVASNGTPFIAAPVDPLIPIGYTTILEDIYFFAAVDNPAYTDIYPTDSGLPVNDSYTEPGYIFKLQYDESTNITTLTLVYAAYLDFTKYAPIAPSAAIGRYESDVIKRLYWSDFYNKVRTINVGDPMVMALNPALAGLTPSVGFDIPIMTNIITGSLPVGTFELCYRLKQSLGAITNYSVLSNMVHLAAPDIGDFLAYEGSVPGTNSQKGIRWKISNIDNNFDRIEVLCTFRDSKTDVAKVYSVTEVNIPTSREISVDLTTLNNLDEILLTDFLTIQSSFTHAKTVDTKDNRLFWGNVKTKTGSLASYDARAFRAKTSNISSTDIIVTNNGVSNSPGVNLATAIAYPETSDCINEYYTNTGAFGADACYFKPDTAGGILGGKGANISYEFGTVATRLDWRFGLNNSNSSGQYNADGSFNIYNDVPFRAVPGRTNTEILLSSPNDSPNQTYIQDSLDCLKSPYRSTILRGYQHEEIYRFGIQFYDLEGVPYFVKWIGDIKMPSYGDYNNNPDPIAAAAGISDFRLSFNYNTITTPTGSSTEIWGQSLCIIFNVDVSSIEDLISGYRIVRMERNTDTNKTILGTGLITPTFARTGETEFYLPANFKQDGKKPFQILPIYIPPVTNGYVWWTFPGQDEWETLTLGSLSGGETTAYAQVKTFDSLDFDLNGTSYSSGDRLFIRSRQVSKNYIDSIGADGFGYRWFNHGTSNDDWYDLNTASVFKTANSKPISNMATPGLGQFNGNLLNFQSGLDTGKMPYYIHVYVDNLLFGNFATVSADPNCNKTISNGQWVNGNTSVALGVGGNFNNFGTTYDPDVPGTRPCVGKRTLVLEFNGVGFNEFNAPYNCNPSTDAGKVFALYYRPNTKQYGGNTYAMRAGNEYIAAGSYVPIVRDGIKLDNNINASKTLEIEVFGGDVYLGHLDIQKAAKNNSDSTQAAPKFNYYDRTGVLDITDVGGGGGILLETADARVSVTYIFPCTNMANQEMRFGAHINTSLTYDTYTAPDDNLYATYHSNESNVVKYFSEPLDFVETNKWINRIYYSEIKYNNETTDSWQVYKTNNFYDVEGNYGQIFSLQAFKGNLYYIQERGFGILYVNPMTAVTSDNNIPVVLGLGDTIQRHNYIALDIGTLHQWSVFRSPNAISFIDSRHKAQYMFDGNSLQCVSDLKGQRNFFVKRFHPELILRDNPIIGKGVHTTYDYYHKEFLTTFNNDAFESTDLNYEKYTLVFSEAIGAYSSFYTFTPKIYLNNNRYMLSYDDIQALYVHNVGYYGVFYETENPAYIKVLVNDNPRYTKVFDNLSFATESIDDQVEWIDDIMTSNSNSQAYSDNINKLTDTFNQLRCYNEYQNTDWTELSVNTNLKKREQTWNTFVPRNKVDYDVLVPSTSTIFDPAVLTKTDFGERMRDKYLVVDLRYDNTNNYRFIIHNLITAYRPSAR